MTEIKPATDAEIAEYFHDIAENRAEGGPNMVWADFADQLVARIRQEQRAREAAERVVVVVRLTPHSTADPSSCSLCKALRAYDAAKAAGFPKEG